MNSGFSYNPRRRSRSRNRRSRSMSRFERQPSAPVDLVHEVMENIAKDEVQPELNFGCQLAHGSTTLKITNFSSVAELFGQIAQGFNISQEEIIFCTINSPNINMKHLFTSTIEPEDMIYAHVRGRPVEVELKKRTEALGVTIADNGLCCAFIKDIKEGSVAAAARPAVAIGQLIESIQGESVIGRRHYEVARIIRSIPIGQPFVMRLVSPKTSGFNFIQPRSGKGKPSQKAAGSGMGTIRFKADGGVVVQTEGPNRQMVEKLNGLFDTYLGVQDDELAQTIWDTAQECQSLQEMMQKVRDSELKVFNFPDELIFDMWGIVSDLKRAQKKPTSPAS